MEIRSALKEQYRAGLAMLSQCVDKCPDDLWATTLPCVQDPDRTIVRACWRIAFHAAYFTHLYLGQTEDSFQPWPGRRPGWFDEMWAGPWDMEPFELPEDTEPLSREELRDYIAHVDSLVGPVVDGLDLDAEYSGFSWYRRTSKLSHELLNLRHLQGHVGQLSEILMGRGIDIDWVSGTPRD